MLNLWQPKQLREEVKPAEGGAPPAPAPAPADPPAPSAPELDDHGYEKPAPVSAQTPEPKKVEPPAPPEIKEPATGYDKDIPEDKEVPPAVPPVVDPKDAEIEKHLGDLAALPKEEVEKIKTFAKANEMTEKQLKAYGDLRRQEAKDLEGARAKAAEDFKKDRIKMHREWQQELKKDPVFGGDNFSSNVTSVERLVQDFLPEYKKKLTEAGGMMPPYLMRDLVKLAKSVYKTEPLVHGDPPPPPAAPKKDGPINPLDFYEEK